MTKKNHIRDLKISGVLAGRRLTEGWYWGIEGGDCILITRVLDVNLSHFDSLGHTLGRNPLINQE